jgi:hypothetical protein
MSRQSTPQVQDSPIRQTLPFMFTDFLRRFRQFLDDFDISTKLEIIEAGAVL